MRSFLERYENGEYEPVWEELVALGAAVREQPLKADAEAVARATMRRARQNIVILLARLSDMGYVFGYDSWVEPEERHMVQQLGPVPPPFLASAANVKSQLDAFEARVGLLPVALRAWYEQVGAVNFVGVFPHAAAADHPGFLPDRQVRLLRMQAQGNPQVTAKRPECRHDVDPLWVATLDGLERSAFRPRGVEAGVEAALAPDEYFKYLYGGGGSYTLMLPNAGADAPLDGEWHNTTFVSYLRICFRWGGFPGLECQTRRPQRELAILTEGLAPM